MKFRPFFFFVFIFVFVSHAHALPFSLLLRFSSFFIRSLGWILKRLFEFSNDNINKRKRLKIKFYIFLFCSYLNIVFFW